MVTPALVEEATALLELLRARNLMLATAESCTGGLIAATLTEVAGSSDVVERGFVTYSNDAKHDLLAVPDAMLERYGAVSEPVAIAMAEGALRNSRAHVTISVTGVAGPGGGTPTKPVGLVHFGCAMRGQPTVHARQVFADNGRQSIRLDTVAHAFRMIREMVTAT
ncbi:MAG: CinA family protein [Pseudomonadota bacterium]|nr:CinA family protein [Pseudomonadota bacterium]